MQRLARQAVVVPTDPLSSSSSTTSESSTSSSTSASSSDSSSASSSSTSLPSSVSSTIPPTSVDTTASTQPSDTSLGHSSSANDTFFRTSSPADFITSRPSPSASENITIIVTTIGSQATTFTSHLPTSLVGSQPGTPTSARTAIIAGATSAFLVLLCLTLGAIFAYRKHKLRHTLSTFGKKKEGKGLLDGEDFDDEDVVPMRSYTDHPRVMSPAPSLLKSRTSETGSIFREEVWPPPGFIDPIAKHSSQVDLSRIVDDVMGPFASTSNSRQASDHDRQGSGSTSHQGLPSTSHDRDVTDASTFSHSRFSTMSSHSTTPLISQPSQPTNSIPMTNPTTNYTDPFQSPTTPPSAFYPYQSALPPGALPPVIPGSASNTHPSSSRQAPLSGPSPASSQAKSQPKRSSPLARALTGDAKIWLGRNLHR
ncbi:hypothetical protein GALMADRAFT_138179 [Galerina marginata CBS 339.88]|uniref:Uncharacterized protein n=1 Tax=Galerina marginata (strain CBS 339.88) TaxID=685588 RepID=A0A067T4I4_GALM3|nr:hypothetical protein GALMADRAFT_138179 [Galerina marginata CBS 339.88]